jgi:ATP-binding cassette subfamily B protein
MLKRFFSYYKPHKKLFILDMSVAVMASLLMIIFPFLTRKLLKVYLPAQNISMIVILLTVIFVLCIFIAYFSYIRIKWGHILGTRMEHDMRNDIFRHIQKLSFNYFDNVKTGHLMSRISGDLNYMTEVAHHAPEDLLLSISLIVGAFSFMFSFNYKMALISMLPIPLMLTWGIIVGKRLKKKYKNIREKSADINSAIENSVQGIREVKSYANEELEISKFAEVNYEFRRSKEKAFTLMGIFHSVMRFMRDSYYLVVIMGGAWLIFKKELDVSDLVAFLLYVGIILPPIDRLINFVEQFYQGVASFERFIEIMDLDPDIQDKKEAYSFGDVKGGLKLENINFKYNENQENILSEINLNIPAGKSIALVGESGAGKSTVISLIPRFYEPISGEIYIDGHNIMDLEQKFLRENIGIVQQNVFLFDTTIRDNILYGNPDASDDAVINAAKKANIYDFIQTLPDGFETYVGERGVKLSGGQKQRVSIARVFLKNPPILIFDEATSALDTESEKLIQESMIELSKNRTTIIIAHRLSTVKHVDEIYVMKQGKVVENGTHQQLVDIKGYYYSLNSRDLF